LHYEGTRSVTLIFKDNKKIEIAGFSPLIFIKTNSIDVGKINNLDLVCIVDKNDSTSYIGINIISFVKNSPINIKIENVNDLVENYDVIYNYILTFPTKPEDAKLVNMHNRVDKNKDHWCYIKKLNPNN
jgi:hypothetical protein